MDKEKTSASQKGQISCTARCKLSLGKTSVDYQNFYGVPLGY